ncbi:MAG: hypothetical protein WCD69_05800 [Xanthobacteraceae bacterium]
MLKRREKEVGQVLLIRCNDVFPPEATAAMGEAYDTAIAALHNDAKAVLIVRERIAKRIMRAAYAGEIDQERLRQSGLSGFRALTKGCEASVVTVRDLLPDNTFWV